MSMGTAVDSPLVQNPTCAHSGLSWDDISVTLILPTDGQTDERTDRRTKGRTDEGTEGQKDGRKYNTAGRGRNIKDREAERRQVRL